MPLEEGYARLRQAERLVLDGERTQAEDAVAAVLPATTEAGAGWLRDQLEGLARRGRLSMGADDRPVADAAVDPLGLTERELAVLELVTRGKTNREIGEELFMAEKTASVHVSRIPDQARGALAPGGGDGRPAARHRPLMVVRAAPVHRQGPRVPACPM